MSVMVFTDAVGFDFGTEFTVATNNIRAMVTILDVIRFDRVLIKWPNDETVRIEMMPFLMLPTAKNQKTPITFLCYSKEEERAADALIKEIEKTCSQLTKCMQSVLIQAGE